MVLRSYFDGGNQADSRRYDVLSLAAVSGTHDVWVPFEKAWRRVLKKHKVAYLHTTDAVARRGIYAGWTEKQSDKFLRDCVDVAAKHSARIKVGDVPGRYGLYCFVVSFALNDFVEFARNNPLSSQNVNEACVRQVIPEVISWSNDQASSAQCHLFFDQGEPFHGILKQILESKKALKDAYDLKKITHRTESDMRLVPALQLADLYAWTQSHRKSPWEPKWKMKLLRTHFRWEWLDKTNLDQVIPGHHDIWLSWKIPKRASTK